jgi:hypothetical protein
MEQFRKTRNNQLLRIKHQKCIITANCAAFEVMVMKGTTVFWDITPCSPLKVNRRFGGTYRLYLQGRRISGAGNKQSRVDCLPEV